MDYSRLEKDIIEKLQQELSKKLHYHRTEHSIHVINIAESIARSESIKGDDLLLLKSAALLHDTGFLKYPIQNESMGCRIAEKILPDYGYTPEQIKLIDAMIMATAIPQNPTNLLEKIICDADLSYLGTSDAMTESNNLRLEMKLLQHRVFSDIEWIDFQLDFLRAHNFFTTYARKYIEPGKGKFIKILLSEKQALGDR
ncbi:MAG: HD domain-containing protein [Victivallales bacterium]|nr:HD domain-containing protein [Victivallales bacterium]